MAAATPPPVPEEARLEFDYEAIEEIGRGGMGVVYKARQTKLGRVVALKLMLQGRAATELAKKRVRNEAQVAARLQHPNIVAVYDVGEHEGAPFIAMEYVAGSTLNEVAKSRAFTPNEVAELIRSLAQAIQYAHENGVIHRDLKPTNVIIDSTGRPRITDFGLAKHLESDLCLTMSGETFGTPSFMSPEQAGGKLVDVGPPSDVYSLGGILYFLLAGRPPFCADTRDEVLRQVRHDDPVIPRRLNSSTPLDLQTICLKSLDKNPSRRYGSAQELADDLVRFLRKEPIRAKPTHVGKKVWRWCQRQPKVATLVGALIAALGLAALATLMAISGLVVNLHQAEQNAAEQKRLREIAEEALRNLQRREESSYQTAGIFRFRPPPGFTPIAGEALGVLKQAMTKKLTVQESKQQIGARLDPLRQAMKQGPEDYGRQSGLSEPSDGSADLLSVYESPEGEMRFWFMRTTHPEPITFGDLERSVRERVGWLISHSIYNKGASVTVGSEFGGHSTVQIESIEQGVHSRQFIVFVPTQPTLSYTLVILLNGTDDDSSWITKFLESVVILSANAASKQKCDRCGKDVLTNEIVVVGKWRVCKTCDKTLDQDVRQRFRATTEFR